MNERAVKAVKVVRAASARVRVRARPMTSLQPGFGSGFVGPSLLIRLIGTRYCLVR